MKLTLRDAVKMALRFNLGQIEGSENLRVVRGQRLQALSLLLPQVNAGVAENVGQITSAPLGIKSPVFPRVVGPFSYSTAEATVSQTLFSLQSIQRFRAARTAEQAAQMSYDDTLDVITLTVGNAYLQVIEAASRIEASEAQVRNAQAIRLIKSVMRGSFEGNLNLRSLHCLDAESILRITKQITESAAAEGNCVIVGRGSQHHLRDRTDTLRIFLFAPRADKIRRLSLDGIPESEAEQLIDMVDQERAEFIEKYFRMEWPNRSLYHALLNTAAGEAVVTTTILGLKEKMDKVQGLSAVQVS